MFKLLNIRARAIRQGKLSHSTSHFTRQQGAPSQVNPARFGMIEWICLKRQQQTGAGNY